MNFFKLFAALFFVAMMALPGVSVADTTAPPPAGTQRPQAGSFFANIEGSMREFSKNKSLGLSNQMKEYAFGVAEKSKSAALKIGSSLALVYLLFEVLQFLSGRTKSMLVVLFDVGIPCLIAGLLVNNYQPQMAMFEGLLDVFRSIGSGDPVTAIMNMYGAALGSIGTAIKHAFSEIGSAIAAVTEPTKFLVSIVDLFATLFFALVILGLILTGIAEVLGLLLLGPFLFAVGVAFGPILIVGIVTPWTREYFTKWVQFIVISAGLTGVINVIFSIAGTLMGAVGITSYSGGEPTAVSMVIMTVLLLSINSMISQAPGITSALFPGHVGASKGAGGQVGKALSNGKDGMKRGAQATGKTVGKAAQLTKGFVNKVILKK